MLPSLTLPWPLTLSVEMASSKHSERLGAPKTTQLDRIQRQFIWAFWNMQRHKTRLPTLLWPRNLEKHSPQTAKAGRDRRKYPTTRPETTHRSDLFDRLSLRLACLITGDTAQAELTAQTDLPMVEPDLWGPINVTMSCIAELVDLKTVISLAADEAYSSVHVEIVHKQQLGYIGAYWSE